MGMSWHPRAAIEICSIPFLIRSLLYGQTMPGSPKRQQSEEPRSRSTTITTTIIITSFLGGGVTTTTTTITTKVDCNG